MITGPLVDAVSRIVGEVLDAAFGDDEPSEEEQQEEEEQARLQHTAWELQRAYVQASGGSDLDVIITALSSAIHDGREALLAWLDLIEEIVQLAEFRFGTQAGAGEFKAEQAKAAVRRLLQRPDGRTAAALQMLGPDAIDLLTGWLIDVTVELLNYDRSLWVASDEDRRLRIPLRARFIAAVVRILARPLAWFTATTPLDPELYDEVERIARGPGSPLTVVDSALELAGWVAEHPEQTLALVRLVTLACDEVEYFQNLEGEAKQGYARNLVLVALTTAGLDASSAVYPLIGVLTDVLIDFTVATNNKRGRYDHRP